MEVAEVADDDVFPGLVAFTTLCDMIMTEMNMRILNVCDDLLTFVTVIMSLQFCDHIDSSSTKSEKATVHTDSL
jgi:hypothetical protein